MIKKKWYSIGQWDQPVLFTSIESGFSLGKYSRLLSPGLPGGFKVASREFYFEMAAFQRVKSLMERTDYVSRLVRYHKQAFKRFDQLIVRHSPTDVSSDQQAKKLFTIFVDECRDVAYFFDAGLFVDDVLLTKILKKVDFSTAALLVKSNKPTDLNRELTSLRRIARNLKTTFGSRLIATKPTGILSQVRAKKDKSLLRSLQSHATKYSYLPTQLFRGTPWTLEDYIVRAQDLQRKGEVKHPPPSISNIKLDLQTAKYIKQARAVNELRAERIEHINKWIWKLGSLWEYLMKRFNLSWKELAGLSYQEIFQALETGKVSVAKKELRLRDQAYSSLWRNGKFTVHSSPMPKAKHHQVDRVSGHPASPGLVRARVVVILGTDDFRKFKNNHVLVAPLTTPNYVAIMAKAAAIVTDSGGITSHAAVVSRELHIPCVVGTKIATQVFRDGDLVEVDATKGIVKLLKKS